MFLHRLAAGLVFASGAGLSRMAVLDDSWALMLLGFAAAVSGLAWFTNGGPPTDHGRARPTH